MITDNQKGNMLKAQASYRETKTKKNERFTVIRSMEMHIELIHAIIHHIHLVIAHHPINFKPIILNKTERKKAQQKIPNK